MRSPTIVCAAIVGWVALAAAVGLAAQDPPPTSPPRDEPPAQQPAPPDPLQRAQPANWTEAIEPFAIADGVYWVGSADLSSYLFTSADGHILIDAPLEANVDLVLRNVEKLGFKPRDIKVLLASHGHFDHTGGMATLLERTGAQLLLSPEEAKLVGAGGRGDFFLGDRAGYRPAKAARTLADGETVRVGDRALTAHFTPGHTRGCTSWSGTVKIAGKDVPFVSICSLSVLPGYVLAGDHPSYPGIARDYCSSVATLRTLRPEIFLGAHGSFFGMAEKLEKLQAGDARAFVDPAGYQAYLDHAQEQVEKTLAEQGTTGGCKRVLAGG